MIRKYQTPVEGLNDKYSRPASTLLDQKSRQYDSQLHCLPPEILEQIIMYLDGKSASRLASTCGLFYNIVNEVASWRKYVLTLPKRHFESVNPHFGAPHIPNPEFFQVLPWKEIYICGQCVTSIHTWNFLSPMVYKSIGDEISCINIAGQAIIFGTQTGEIAMWNPDESKTTVKSIFNGALQVNEILVQLYPDFDKKSLHYRIIAHFSDTSLYVYDARGYLMFSNFADKNLRKISSHGDNLFEWNIETGKSAFSYLKESDIIRCSDYSNFQLPFGPFVAVDIIEHLFVSQEHGPYLVHYDRLTNNLRYQQLLKQAGNLCITKAYVWPGQISFSITMQQTTIISVGKRCNVIKWPFTFNCISACLFGNVLIVGTNLGQVLFYPFQDPSNLLNLDPNAYTKKLQMQVTEPLIYVGIRVQNCAHDLPDVVAASRRALYCCRASGILKM